MKIEEIDRNFVAKTLGSDAFHFLDVTQSPFSLEGLPWRTEQTEPRFSRLPIARLQGKVNKGACNELSHHTAGALVRFRTDAGKIALHAELADSCDMNHMPRCGSAGFDLYLRQGGEWLHCGTAQPDRDEIRLERILCADPQPGTMREYLLNFPLYGGATQVEIGLTPGAAVEAPTPHRVPKPILFYGSSITQGGCASRPGNAYTSMLCRAVDAEGINLGFSGCGLGEIAMAELIAELDLSLFVFDYDHNAPNAEHLQKTHEPFFKAIRRRRPELPVIMMSKCDIWPAPGDAAYQMNAQRRSIIRTTCERAVASGDRNVYFIDGETLFGDADRTACTVDRCHPNDLGFYRMYQRLLPVVKTILKLDQ